MEPFDPTRMAGRILGMGDIVGLVEGVVKNVDEAEAREMERKMSKGRMGLDDFLSQLKMMKKMGPLDRIIGMMPGLSGLADKVDPEQMEKELRRREAMIHSMTNEERRNPKVLNGGRRKRIAAGAGVAVSDLNRFLKEFDKFSEMMRKFSGKGMRNLFKGLTTQGFF
jgi:signal recognition particle subunit SRP54